MNENFKNTFNKLSTNEKRNQISNELLIISELIKNIENKYNLPSALSVKNYKTKNDEKLTESEMLSFIYEDIYNIEREIITLTAAIDINNNN